MNGELWQFGEFQLDVTRKILWHRETTIAMPLKGLEVLSMLVRNAGHLVTKDELVNEIWGESFVEESNLSRHIYLLRKTLKDLGADDGLIVNVPRRGYRFAGDARSVKTSEIVLERHSQTRTLIDYQEEITGERQMTRVRRRWLAAAAVVLVLSLGAVYFGYQFTRAGDGRQEIGSIAVLPFKSIGTAGTEDHSGAGLADILTTRLSSIKNLKIRPAASATGLGEMDAAAAAQKLGVDSVLEGTIYRTNDKVRVTARLISGQDGSIIWSGEFEKLTRDELLLQLDIAMQIVPALAINVGPGEREAIAKHYTESADAYELYIRGRHEWNKRSTPGMYEAQRMFRNAIAADPKFALAYVGLADTLLTSQPYKQEAEAVIGRALELDPNLGEAHASQGFYLMFYDWNWSAAELSFRKAIELNPGYPTAHHWYATLLSIKGDIPGAKVEMHKALDLNPLSHNFLADLGQLHYFAGEYAEAENYCRKALDLYPEFSLGHEYLHFIYLATGRHEEAIAELATADVINQSYADPPASMSEILAKHAQVFRSSGGMAGYYEYRYPRTVNSPELFYFQAMKHAIAGEREKALDYLEKSTDTRMFLSAFAKANPVFNNLRSEPRYQEILRKMGLS